MHETDDLPSWQALNAINLIPNVPLPERLRTPESRLAFEMIDRALLDADAVHKPRTCMDARLWLRDNGALLSARYCFELLGLDYEACVQRLEIRWKRRRTVRTESSAR